VVAVTKMDRADPDLAELAGEEVRELLAEQGIDATVVPCSAKTGEGVDRVREAMVAAIEATPPPVEAAASRLWVDRVFSVHGSGTVVTGTLVEGRLRVGDPLRVVGPERELAVAARALHVHGQACDEIAAPTRLAINLGGAAGRPKVSADEVDRGDLVTSDPHVAPTRVLDVWLANEPGVTIRRGSQASIFVGTSRSTTRIQPIESAGADGSGQLARLRLNAPLVAAGGDRFVLRGAQVDGPAGAVIGGGEVLDARPPARVRAAKRVALLEAARLDAATDLVRALAAEASPRPLPRSALHSRFSVQADRLIEAADGLVAASQFVAVSSVGWMTEAGLAALEARARELVEQHHRSAPLEPGLRLQTLRERLSASAGPEATGELLERITKASANTTGDRLVIEGDTVRSSAFAGAEQDEDAARALACAKKLLAEAALQGVTEHATAEACGTDPKTTRAVLAVLVRQDAAVRAGDLWFDAAAVGALRERIEEHLRREGKLVIADFKQMTGLGRRQTIPLLEHFDRTGVTRREGDARVAGR
jgi:selenocysteine-specific elongation factor